MKSLIFLILLAPSAHAQDPMEACKQQYRVAACQPYKVYLECDCGDGNPQTEKAWQIQMLVPSQAEFESRYFFTRYFMRNAVKESALQKGKSRMAEVCQGSSGKINCTFP